MFSICQNLSKALCTIYVYTKISDIRLLRMSRDKPTSVYYFRMPFVPVNKRWRCLTFGTFNNWSFWRLSFIVIVEGSFCFVYNTFRCISKNRKRAFFHLPSRLIYLPKALLREHVLSPNGLRNVCKIMHFNTWGL